MDFEGNIVNRKVGIDKAYICGLGLEERTEEGVVNVEGLLMLEDWGGG